MKKGDIVNIKAKHLFDGQKRGKILRSTNKSGQVLIKFDINDTTKKYWFHLDNELEINKYSNQ